MINDNSADVLGCDQITGNWEKEDLILFHLCKAGDLLYFYDYGERMDDVNGRDVVPKRLESICASCGVRTGIHCRKDVYITVAQCTLPGAWAVQHLCSSQSMNSTGHCMCTIIVQVISCVLCSRSWAWVIFEHLILNSKHYCKIMYNYQREEFCWKKVTHYNVENKWGLI